MKLYNINISEVTIVNACSGVEQASEQQMLGLYRKYVMYIFLTIVTFSEPAENKSVLESLTTVEVGS